jgi:transcriptional regulator of acetoin/glycerol metabolism
LAQLAWPGNIRELRSVLTRITLAETSGLIKESSLDALMSTTDAVRDNAPSGAPTLREETRHRIAEVLRQANGNVSETARRLGTSRNTIYRAIDATQKSDGPIQAARWG